MHLERRYSRVAIDDLRSPVLRHIIGVWESKRKDRAYPARAELRPQDFAPFLRHLALARATEGGDFEIRIVGDEIVQAYGDNFAGRTLSSLADLIGDDMVEAYRAVVTEGRPVLLHGFFERTRDHHFRREVLLLPLGADGPVEFVLSAGMLLPRESGLAAA